jgi:hypothetical protein
MKEFKIRVAVESCPADSGYWRKDHLILNVAAEDENAAVEKINARLQHVLNLIEQLVEPSTSHRRY